MKNNKNFGKNLWKNIKKCVFFEKFSKLWKKLIVFFKIDCFFNVIVILKFVGFWKNLSRFFKKNWRFLKIFLFFWKITWQILPPLYTCIKEYYFLFLCAAPFGWIAFSAIPKRNDLDSSLRLWLAQNDTKNKAHPFTSKIFKKETKFSLSFKKKQKQIKIHFFRFKIIKLELLTKNF